MRRNEELVAGRHKIDETFISPLSFNVRSGDGLSLYTFLYKALKDDGKGGR